VLTSRGTSTLEKIDFQFVQKFLLLKESNFRINYESKTKFFFAAAKILSSSFMNCEKHV